MNEELLSAFNKTLQFYEVNEKELFTISEMCKTMTSFCGELYSKVYMKQKLMERYGNGITRVGEEDLINFFQFPYDILLIHFIVNNVQQNSKKKKFEY